MPRFKEFREEQRLPTWGLVLLGLLFLAAIVGSLIQISSSRPAGFNVATNIFLVVLVAICAIGVPALFISMKLVIETTQDGVHVQFRPLLNRIVRYDEIQSALAKTYSPIREYGGWGIRGFGKRVAYNARGNEGVLLTLKSGATIMLGSQRPAELQTAIESGLP